MKRKIITSLLILPFLCGNIFAQGGNKTDDRKVIFGLKAGANLSWYKADTRNLSKGGFKPGFSYGIMGDYNFQPNYSASFELLISTINGKLAFKDSMTYLNKRAGNIEYAYSNRYVQIPISIKFRTKEIGYMKYFAQFGLAPGIRVSSRAKLSGSNLPWPEEDIKSIKTNDNGDDMFHATEFDDQVRFVNIPLIIGGGIEYNLSGNTSIYANLRYENGFTNVLNDKKSKTGAFSKNVALSLGVFF